MDEHALILTDANFDAGVVHASQPTLVNFWAPWCTPCLSTLPVLDHLAHKFDGRAAVGKLNVNEYVDTAARYDVRTIPTLLVFYESEVIARETGVFARKQIVKQLNSAIASVTL